MAKVYVIGTCDTKGDELRFVCDCVRRAGARPVLVDVSTAVPDRKADVTADTVASHHPKGRAAVLGHADRGQAVSAMAEALKHYLLSRKNIGAVLGLGGGGNTAIVTEAMRALPVGVPKIMVSTLASGHVASFVGSSDIMMMHAVTASMFSYRWGYRDSHAHTPPVTQRPTTREVMAALAACIAELLTRWKPRLLFF